jgi:hypothetical protein
MKSYFRDVLLRYFLNYFELVTLASFVTGVLLLLLLLLKLLIVHLKRMN